MLPLLHLNCMLRIRSIIAYLTDSSQNLNWMVFFFGVLMYTNILPDGFTFGDELVGTGENTITSRGISAIPDIFTETGYGWFDYQPLAKASFALEYSLVGQYYLFSNFVQIGLFGLVCLVMYLMIGRLLSGVSPALRLMAILLFVAHPANTIVVNSLLGRAEMLGFIFFGLGTIKLIDWLELAKPKSLVLALLLMVLGLLSQPQVMSWFLLPVFAVWVNGIKGKSKVFGLIGCLLGAIFVYALFRIGNLSDPNILAVYNPLIELTGFSERLAAGLYVLLHGFKLLMFPHTLLSSYSYGSFEMVGWNNPMVYISLLILIAQLLVVFLARKRLPMLAFGAFLILIDLVPFSNLFSLQSSIFDEKSLFGATLGICLIIVSLIGFFLKVKDTDTIKQVFVRNNSFRYLLLLLLVLGGYKTYSRNYVWVNNYKLTTVDAESDPNAAIANFQAGKYLRVEYYKYPVQNLISHIDSAAFYLNKSIDIFDQWPTSIMELGELRLQDSGQPGLALQLFEKAAQIEPENPEIVLNIGLSLSSLGRTGEAIEMFGTVLEMDPTDERAMEQILMLYTNNSYFDEAEYVNQRYFQLHPESAQPYLYQSKILLSRNDTVKALDYLNEAKTRNPEGQDINELLLKFQSPNSAK